MKKFAYLIVPCFALLAFLQACEKGIDKKSLLEKKSTLYGHLKVLDSTGNPVADLKKAYITLNAEIKGAENTSTFIELKVNCDSAGNFKFENLPEQKSDVLVAHFSDQSQEKVVTDRSQLAEIEMKLGGYNDYYNLSLNINDAPGWPVNKGKLYLFSNPNDCKPAFKSSAYKTLDFTNGFIKLNNLPYKDFWILGEFTDASNRVYYSQNGRIVSNTSKVKEYNMNLGIDQFWAEPDVLNIQTLHTDNFGKDHILSGCKVYLFNSEYERNLGDLARARATTVSDLNGNCKFSNSPSSGVYYLYAFTTYINVKMTAHDQTTGSTSKIIKLDTAEYYLNIAVRDADNSALADAKVYLYTSLTALQADSSNSKYIEITNSNSYGQALFKFNQKQKYYAKVIYILTDKKRLYKEQVINPSPNNELTVTTIIAN